jgi:heat-inducible transcriptional repressor
MIRQDPLSPREAGILHSIVQSYIETGEPVGSVALSRLRNLKVSPATIRNVMADLTEQGFLSQPHTSAGRVPTQKAIQAYVKSLAVRVVSAELARMRQELQRARTVEQRAERSSHILSQLTRNVGIVASIPDGARILSQLELVALPANKVLMVVVMGSGDVHNQVLELDHILSGAELVSIRNYLNENFVGWRLSDALRELERRLQQEAAAYDSVLQSMLQLHLRGLLDIALDPEVHLGGASNLVGFDLHLTREAMRDLFRTLEEKKRVMELLDRFLENYSEEPGVQVGLAEVHPSMESLSLVGLTIEQPDGRATRVAVLGPNRMDYARAISAVVHMRQALRGIS